ncbi:MAG: type II toxin-antitoxin system prevent-host-death family antitoxin [Solirubrobacteraceae bacterium]|nr:type II toxin-antitoxin system prevent-host-death family antitoxin [Solirubrobacteraceae bacterium]
MKTVGAFEAKTHLSRLLDKVEQGEKITITRHGAPVAQLVPVEAEEKPDVKKVIEQIRAFRKGNKLNGLSLRKMIEEGRA